MNAAERQKIIDDTKAKAKHSRLYAYDVPHDEQGSFVLFHMPSPKDIATFRKNANDDQLTLQKEETLVLSCLEYPEIPAYMILTGQESGYPGLHQAIANEIWRVARGGDSVAKKV
jgi:hypothetical protein